MRVKNSPYCKEIYFYREDLKQKSTIELLYILHGLRVSISRMLDNHIYHDKDIDKRQYEYEGDAIPA